MRKTKIVCTLGPATDKEGVLREMMLSGPYYCRLTKQKQVAEYGGNSQ